LPFVARCDNGSTNDAHSGVREAKPGGPQSLDLKRLITILKMLLLNIKNNSEVPNMSRLTNVCIGAGAAALTASSAIAGCRLTGDTFQKESRGTGIATGLAIFGTISLMVFVTVATLCDLE
jgi:hypothetical protein